PTSAVPFNTSPLVTVTLAPEYTLPTSSVPLSVTPSSSPLLTSSEAPLLVVTAPPAMVPPTSRHALVCPLNTSWGLASLSVPVRLTVPARRLSRPRLFRVKPPPRLTVLLVALMLPVLVQFPPKLRVHPAPALKTPPLLKPLGRRRLAPLRACARPELLKVR